MAKTYLSRERRRRRASIANPPVRGELTLRLATISLAYPVTAPGSTLDYNAYISNAAPRTCFDADDARPHSRITDVRPAGRGCN